MRKQKVVHMTSVHNSRDVRIFEKECKSLVAAGYEVVLVAPGSSTELVDGVTIVGVPPGLGRFDRVFRTAGQVFWTAYRIKADIYHFHDPELMPWGVLLKLLGKKVVYDVHEDLAADIRDKPWIPTSLRRPIARAVRIAEAACSFVYDGIVITRPSMAGLFPKHKTALVHNYPILGELAPPSGTRYSDRPEIAAYVGGGTPERGIREIVQALNLVPSRSELQLHFAGTITPEAFLNELRGMPGWVRVRYLGWQNRERVAALLSTARFGIVMFLPIANHVTSEPTKLFEYMSARLPVIASNIPHWEEIIGRGGFGVVADPEHPGEICAAMLDLLARPGDAEGMAAKGFQAVTREFNWGASVRNLLCMYQRILA